eukprot:3789359-Prymnesium_polylepis.1
MAAAGLPRRLAQYIATNMSTLEGIFRSWSLDMSRGVPRREFDQALQLLSMPALPGDVDACFELFPVDGSTSSIDFGALKAAVRHSGGGLDQQGVARFKTFDDK